MIKFNSDSIILVSGASSGIGKSISTTLIQYGAKVIGVSRNAEKLNKLKDELGGNFNYQIKDLVSDIESNSKFINEISDKFGKLSGLVLNAGNLVSYPLQATKYQKSKELFDLNFHANLSLLKGFSKPRNNIGQGSSVVAISSIVSNVSMLGTVSYGASKAALNSLVRTSAIELSRSGIRVNSILPGHIKTEALKSQLSEEFLSDLEDKYPLGLGKESDVANLASFLLSDSSRWITGQEIIIDGGASIKF